jgi:glucose uptake protein
MVLVHNYGLAVFFFVISMICWGSWANTQKLAEKTWRFELFYWDLTIGLLLTALLAALTFGFIRQRRPSFIEDVAQANSSSILNAMLGGCGLEPGQHPAGSCDRRGRYVGRFSLSAGGIAWILASSSTFILVVIDKGEPEGNVFLLFGGVAVIIAAIYLSMLIFRRLAREQKKPSAKGILLSVGQGC